jgi:hypothetical protein
MRHLLLAGAIVLSATVTSTAQAPQLDLHSGPVTLTFLTASVEEVVGVIARLGGITIELDATVTDEMRRAPLAVRPVRFNGLLEELLKLITEQNGLTYAITGPKAVRISKKI